ncbi:MAG TPA: RDD family protein [Bdellovibrionota bacterium]|jgi:uncharacterized RDD family membrane protein YckC|nr:RDD family protein [Bdellovibrionota bacterium]
MLMSGAPTGGLKPAGFWIRALASLIDGLLLTLASYAIEILILGAIYLVRRMGGAGDQGGFFEDAFSPITWQALNGSLYAGLAMAYYTIGHLRWGTTLGKYPFRIKVVTLDGKPLTALWSGIRTVAYVPSYLLFATGFLMAGLNPDRRALHELLSGTRSIRLPKRA